MTTETTAAKARKTVPITLRCVECGATGLTLDPGKAYRCEKCGKAYPLHSFQGIPVLLPSWSRLSEADILKHTVEPKKIDYEIAMRHWRTGNMMDLLKGIPGKTLLDFGAGDGGDRPWLESQGYEVTTQEIFPSPNIDYVSDGHALPFADEQFDICTPVAVLCCLYDPFLAVSEIHRVMKKGGTVIGSTGNVEPFFGMNYFNTTHLGLRELLGRAGFKDIELYPGWNYIEALDSNFWIWNRIGAVRKITRPLQRLRFKFGMCLWKTAYKLQGRKPPEWLPYGYAGSLIFRARKG